MIVRILQWLFQAPTMRDYEAASPGAQAVLVVEPVVTP